MDNKLHTLFWEATLNCNAGCPFCGSSCGSVRREEIEGNFVLRAFREVAEAYDPTKIMVNVTGGEPLLRRDLFDVMGQVHRMGFPWGMVTNGSLIDDRTIKRMRETGMSTISVSLDGLGEAHERQRRLPASYPVITGALRKLGEAGFLDCIQITTVVTRENLDSLEEMLEAFSELPADSWRITPVDPIGRGMEQRELLLREKDFETLYSFLDRHAFHEKPVLTTSCSHFLGGRDTRYRAHAFHCEAGISVGSILADGSIFVCPNVPRRPELIQGNIRTDRFPEVWEKGFAWFRDAEQRRQGPCADCKEWDLCKGDSLHTWDFERREPKFCAMRLPFLKRDEKEMPSDEVIAALKKKKALLKGLRFQYGSASTRTVFFVPQASEEMECYFHWGQRHPVNLCEQMVALIGHRHEGRVYVEELVPIPLSNRAEETAAFDIAQHAYVMQELALMNRMLPKSEGMLFGTETPFELLGYLHSHPGDLDAVLSEPDIRLRNMLRDKMPDGCPIFGILNPQSRDLCLYEDSLYSPVDVVLMH